MYRNFLKEIQFGPIFPCICCMKCFTDRGVDKITDTLMQKIEDAEKSHCIKTEAQFRVNGNFYLCKTCCRKLPKGVMPKQCFRNGLELAEVPKCLKISSLGNQLLAKYILFLKLRKTPTSRFDIMNDRVSLNYMHNLLSTINALQTCCR